MDINAVESTYTQIQTGNKSYKNDKTTAKDKEAQTGTATEAAAYEKSTDAKETSEDSSKKIYSKNQTDRSAIVNQMKQEMAKRQQQLLDLVRDMISKQGTSYANASGDDVWKILASGDYEVTPEVQAQAKEDISEDGYWGVKQTSERIFDFAMALAGDDEEAMKKMQSAFEKGFKEATGAWGRELPEISSKTYDAVQKKFEEYFDSKKQ